MSVHIHNNCVYGNTIDEKLQWYMIIIIYYSVGVK